MHMNVSILMSLAFFTDATVSVNESVSTVTEGESTTVCVVLQSTGQILTSVSVMLESGDF